MKLSKLTETELIIEIPNMAFKMICIITICISSFLTLAVLLSREGLINGIIGYILLPLGILGLKFGGKSDFLRLDKELNTLEVVSYSGNFGKPDIKKYNIEDIISVEPDETIFRSSSSSLSGSKITAIRFKLKSGDSFLGTPYVNANKRCNMYVNQISDFLRIKN